MHNPNSLTIDHQQEPGDPAESIKQDAPSSRKFGHKILSLFKRQPHLKRERSHVASTADEVALVEGMEAYRKERTEYIRRERIQELQEQEFEARLSTLEDLASASPEDGVSQRVEDYDGQEILVYDLSGYPFRFLQHDVGYKYNPGGHPNIGADSSKRLLKDPGFWMRNESEITLKSGTIDQEGNTISTSYVDTEINGASGGSVSEHGVIYGFLSIRPDSLLKLHAGDDGTSNVEGHARPKVGSFQSLDDFAKRRTDRYNEVLLRRYDENGRPTPPDCLIVHNGGINEATRHHAAYFGIPIINIEDKPYVDKQAARMVERIQVLDEESSYDEIFQTLQALGETSLAPPPLKEDIYDDYDGRSEDEIRLIYKDKLRNFPEEVHGKMQQLMETIEPAKRLEMLKKEIKRMNLELAQAEKKSEKIAIRSQIGFGRIARGVLEYPDGRSLGIMQIDYEYKLKDRAPRLIRTQIKSTDPVYNLFSHLIDEYEESGGEVQVYHGW